MEPRIQVLNEKKLIGKRMIMSFSNNKTGELWRSFMPRRKEIRNVTGAELFSLQIYKPLFFDKFNPDTEFEKWAAIEVSGIGTVPEEMEPFTLPGGLYAVFVYKGTASAASSIFQYILGTWLPASGYFLDDRPHFELLGEKYKNEDPDSEEEIWIPIKPNL
jgi:AraC family transcriptional regulator